MALAGVASAYDVWTLNPLTAKSTGTVTTTDVTINIEGFTQTPTTAITYVDGSYHYVAAPTGFDFSTGSGATSNAFTLMTYVNFSSLEKDELFIFGTGSDHSGGTAFNYVRENLSLSQKSKSHNESTGVELTANTWYHVALAYDGSDNSLDVFVNGVLKNTVTLGTEYVAPTGTNLYFGSASTNGSQDDFAGSIAQFQIVHGAALNATEIKTIANTPVIPEPTTATLSLLALAGLAARRRRK